MSKSIWRRGEVETGEIFGERSGKKEWREKHPRILVEKPPASENGLREPGRAPPCMVAFWRVLWERGLWVPQRPGPSS